MSVARDDATLVTVRQRTTYGVLLCHQLRSISIARDIGGASKHLERECDTLPSSDAQRRDAALQTVAPHRVQ
jgi:hypothetical protein